MAGQNDFKALATGGSANVLTQSQFAALTSLIANGFQAGVADSKTINKVLRQSSFVAEAIAKIISDNNVDALDDGDVATFKAKLIAAILASIPASSASAGVVKSLQASATGSNSLVIVSADELPLEDSSNNYKTLHSISLSINASTSGANGLDSGLIAGSTWYSVWVIAKSDGTTAGLLSLSSSAPAMPSGYTFKTRVGWIRTDGTANKYPLAFKQSGRRSQYVVGAGNVPNLPQIASGVLGNITTPTWVSLSVSNFMPPTASRGVFVIQNQGNAVYAGMAPNNSYGPATSLSNPPPIAIGSMTGAGQCVGCEFDLEGASVYAFSNSTTSSFNVQGWEDNL